MAEPGKHIIAAGTVTLRPGADGSVEVLLVHRPRYNDWSLPKGKLTSGEYLAACATRETDEESAVRVHLRAPVAEISYPVGGGTKSVTYWRGRPVSAQVHQAGTEVDQIAWLSVTKALRQVSYPDEREVIRQAVNHPRSTPLVILRHGKALARSQWSTDNPDQQRPLDPRGAAQSAALIPLLDAYGVERLVSSESTRCHHTLKPFGKARGLKVEKTAVLTEEVGVDQPKAVTALMRKLASRTAEGTAAAVCGHRPVLPTMLAALGLPDQAFHPAEALVVHLDSQAAVLAVEMHKSLL